jgi:hypothetical protein
MRASCVGLFVKEFSTYVDGVAGSIPPIPGRVIAPPDKIVERRGILTTDDSDFTDGDIRVH